MKKIFFQFGSGLGPMSRSLPIALALAESGYKLKYSGYANAKPYMEKVGIEELNPNFSISDIKKCNPDPYWSTAGQFWEMIGYGNMEWVEGKVNEIINDLKDFKPDIILSDLGILSCIVARIAKIPLIALNQSCYHPNNALGRLTWWEDEKQYDEPILDKLNALLKKYNAKPLNKFTEIFTGDLTIIPSFYEFDPINNLTEYNTNYIGPILWNNDLGENDAIRNHFKSEKPVIFCYTARFRDNVGESGIKIFKSILETSKNVDAKFIVSTGSIQDYNEAKEIMNDQKFDNLQLFDYVPLSIAYGMSDLVIHHGGHGSCLGQFYYEVPSIIIPTHREREYNARMCHKLGVSEFLLRKELNKENLISNIEKLLKEEKYKNNTSKIHDKVKNDFNKLSRVTTLVDKTF